MKKNDFILSINIRYFLVLICLLFFYVEEIKGATIIVGPPPASIQAAINSAAPGDTIQLSPGTYVQEVQVTSKSLDIIGAGQNSTIIQAYPPTTHLTQNFVFGSNFWCVVMIDNMAAPLPQVVNISDLTVDGGTQQDTTIPPIYGSSDRFVAIGYHNASGTVQNVHTTNTKQSSSFNQLAGSGITNASNVGSVSFNVTNCLVDFYQRLGVDFRGSSLTASITGTTVDRGYVLTPNTSTATPNGIQYSGGATGSVINNTIENNIGTVAGAAATGILPFGAGSNLVISGNTISNNDIGIASVQSDNNLTISNNTINFTTTHAVNTVEGILIQDTNGVTTLTSNIMNNIPDINMDLISSANQPFNLMTNQFNGSQIGLQITGNVTTGPIVTMNSDAFSGTIGYYIEEVDAPNNVWPSTATVSFDGLYSGHITLAEYNYILTKIYNQYNDPSLGLVLSYIDPVPPTLSNLNPVSGPSTGGNTVTITGFSFLSSNTQVFFGTTQATNVVVISNTELSVTAPVGVGIKDVTVVTPFGVTPIVQEDLYTYIDSAPMPPTNFLGRVVKNRFLTQSNHILNSSWDKSPSEGVALYRIYNKNGAIAEIAAGSPLVYEAPVRSEKSASYYTITAVTIDNIESIPLRITLVDADDDDD